MWQQALIYGLNRIVKEYLMIETLTLVSNGIVVVAIGALYRKVNSQGKDLNDYIVKNTAEITNRPDFDQVSARIEKAEKRQCDKLRPVKEDLREVKGKLFNHLVESKK